MEEQVGRGGRGLFDEKEHGKDALLLNFHCLFSLFDFYFPSFIFLRICPDNEAFGGRDCENEAEEGREREEEEDF